MSGPRRFARRGERPTRAEAGSTLIEGMIAATVMSIGVLGLVPLFVTSSESTAVASRITQATALGQSKLDELYRLDYEAEELSVGEHSEELSIDISGAPLEGVAAATPDGNFYRRWSVTEEEVNAAHPGGELKIISIEVSWWDRSADRERTVTIEGGKAR